MRLGSTTCLPSLGLASEGYRVYTCDAAALVQNGAERVGAYIRTYIHIVSGIALRTTFVPCFL